MVRNIIRLFITIVFVFIGSNFYGQNTTTSRLTIQSGGSVNFYINTLDKYQNGISYTNWTTATVYFVDTFDISGIQTGLTWKLDVKAMDNNIKGTLGNLPLNRIEIEASNGGGPPATFEPVFALSQFDQSLVTSGTQTNLAAPVLNTVYITYYCGNNQTVANSLLGYPPDHYSVDILLTLGPE